eukprot:scaffold101_cov373-Prasinococcus_capsulatus_cf.AAC.12
MIRTTLPFSEAKLKGDLPPVSSGRQCEHIQAAATRPQQLYKAHPSTGASRVPEPSVVEEKSYSDAMVGVRTVLLREKTREGVGLRSLSGALAAAELRTEATEATTGATARESLIPATTMCCGSRGTSSTIVLCDGDFIYAAASGPWNSGLAGRTGILTLGTGQQLAPESIQQRMPDRSTGRAAILVSDMRTRGAAASAT